MPSSDVALGHPLRVALLDLLRDHGTLTSTQAARALGESSGLCSFHLRQLARYGYIEEAGPARGRVRPWRLVPVPAPGVEPEAEPAPAPGAGDEEFGRLARDLEDEGYRRWLAQREHAPADWRQDEAFSTVLHLSPGELSEVAAEVRAVLSRYTGRSPAPDRRPVAAMARLFPLLPADR
ncbi:MAG TPA: winged helix-turn-helix domain-containing protein [Streptosporangiaceae bacterium]|nr:winged helix-turn-helix domain-containing protein [Streptosporangiaceae bacterium]